VYKRQIYQLAESNRIEKIDLVARIESNRIETFFARIGMLWHPATTRSNVVGVIHKLTVNEFVDHTNTPTTCCGEVFLVQNIEITYVALTTVP